MNETETKTEPEPTAEPETKSQATSNNNIMAAVAYLLAPLSAALIYILEKDKPDKDNYVMFHARQGIVLGVAIIIFYIILGIIAFIPLIGWLIGMLGYLAVLVVWLFMMYKAFTGEEYKLPVIYEYTEKYVK